MSTIEWRWSPFEGLALSELYDILRLRQEVFVVEQNCPFLDADSLDQNAMHLLGTDSLGLAAYLRVHAPGARRAEAVVSRVITAERVRRQGLGLDMMSQAVSYLREQHPEAKAWLGAQQRLEVFYGRFGFVASSEPYLEDDIWHVGMSAPVISLRLVGAVSGAACGA